MLQPALPQMQRPTYKHALAIASTQIKKTEMQQKPTPT